MATNKSPRTSTSGRASRAVAGNADQFEIRNAVSEKDLQQTIVSAARYHGYLVYFTWNSRNSPEGFPDLLIVNPRNGTILVYELKAANGRVRPMQREWIEGFIGGHVESARFVYPDHLDDVLKELEDCA